MVLVGLADITRVLLLLLRLDISSQLRTVVEVSILLLELVVLGFNIALLLSQLLNVLEHDFHVDLVLSSTFTSINLLRDQGSISLTGVGAIIA